MLGAVPDLTDQLFEEGLAALSVLFVGFNLLQVPLGETVKLVLDLLGVDVIIAIDGLVTCRGLLACFSGGLRAANVLFALLRALTLRTFRSLPLFEAELRPGLLDR